MQRSRLAVVAGAGARLALAALAALAAPAALGCIKASPPASSAPLVVTVTNVPGPSVAVDAVGALADAAHVAAAMDGHTPGDRVEVEWQGSWFQATLLERRGDRWFVHYDRFGDGWDETVGRERIRLPVRAARGDATDDDGDP